MKNFLLFASGVNLNILKRKECENDEVRFVCIGGAVVFTAFMGWASAGFALYSVFGSYEVAVALGFAWACAVFNLDRFIVSVMRKRVVRPVNNYSSALVRLGLALLLGYVISYPLKLRVFEAEVATEMQLMAQEKQAAFKTQVAAKYSKELAQLQTENAQLEAQIQQAEAHHKELTRIYLAEADGSAGSGRYGCGPVCRAKRAEAEAAAAALQRQKAANEPLIARNRARINEITASVETASATWQGGHEGGYKGLLARIEGMERLKRKEPAVYWASYLLLALFMAIEIAPILIKMFSSACNYDLLLERHEIRLHDRVKLDIQRTEDDCKREYAILVQSNQTMIDAEHKANQQLSRAIAQVQLELAENQLAEFKESSMANMLTHIRR